MDERVDALAAIAVLSEASRRVMYDYIRRRGRPVTRDEAAAQVGISRKLAAFHLDKLVEAGLLRAGTRGGSTAGRAGPGRAPKLYEPSDLSLSVSIPAQRLDLLGEVLVDAIASAGAGTDPRQAVLDCAGARGRDIGERERASRRLTRTGGERALHVTGALLEELGYEPYRTQAGAVRLANCPFSALAARQRQLVCGMNRALVDGMLRGLGNETVQARLAPQEGECCVEIGP